MESEMFWMNHVDFGFGQAKCLTVRVQKKTANGNEPSADVSVQVLDLSYLKDISKMDAQFN